MFQPVRGCVLCVRAGSGSGGNGFVIDGLKTSGCPPIVITGVTPAEQDIVQPVVTLSQRQYVYVFGAAIGDVQISGYAMLGPRAAADTMQRVVEFVASKRLSSGNSEPVNVGHPGGTHKVWITGMGLGAADAEFNIMPFVINGLLAKPA